MRQYIFPNFKKTIGIMLAITSLSIASKSATINSADCSLSAIQTAINFAQPGDTVSVPAGNCTWSDVLTLPDSKKITLAGAGMNQTVITGSVSFGISGSRVTGFEFTGDWELESEGYGFRLDHCRIRRSVWNNAIAVANSSGSSVIPIATGVVDHNEIMNGRVLVEGTRAMLTEGNQQNYLWALPLDLGGPNAVYVEDNLFSNPSNTAVCNFVDGSYGGRYVFRYNTTNGCYLEAHSSQEGGNRAIRSWEIYGNIINNTGSSIYFPYRIRGGTGMIFGNSVIGTWSNYGIAFDNVRSYASAALGGGLCDGTSLWDGNQDSSGYPCRDQIGRSADNPQWTLSPVGAYTQAYVPAYLWLNKSVSQNLTVSVINSSENHIKTDRDFYDYNSTFSGTSGTGVGTLAARPATCTTGVGYFATNQSTSSLTGQVGASPSQPLSGTLYKCTSTNTWTAIYTPYTYPHPLTMDKVKLQAPSNLRVL
ncbi:MAG: hypothetical protein ACXVCL_19340 [Bdellovibrio sp.]